MGLSWYDYSENSRGTSQKVGSETYIHVALSISGLYGNQYKSQTSLIKDLRYLGFENFMYIYVLEIELKF